MLESWSKNRAICKLELAERKNSVTWLFEEIINTLTHKYINSRSSYTTLRKDIVEKCPRQLCYSANWQSKWQHNNNPYYT